MSQLSSQHFQLNMSTEEGWSGNVYLLAFVKDIEINVARRVYQMVRMKFTYIKWQNKFTFANGYFLPFQVL